MKTFFKILLALVGMLILAYLVYERYYLSKWYYFEMGNIQIEVMSDECETCFLDWPIDHTIWIESENGQNEKFELYTEGPRLEFGFNQEKTKLLINCPGFSDLIIDLNQMEEVSYSYDFKSIELEKFLIQWIINNKQELKKLDSLRLPDTNWKQNETLATYSSSIFKEQTNSIQNDSIKSWNIEDFIIQDQDKKSEAVRQTIEYTLDQWKDTPNPFLATYTGCEIGDYFHLNFEDANGKTYDFGFGNNDYGRYKLFDDENYYTTPKYLDQDFIVHWGWEITTFPCCEGDYDPVEAYLPSITKLELLEANSDEK